MKKYLPIILIFLAIILILLPLTFGLNRARVLYAEKLLEKSRDAELQDRTIYLVESNLLLPGDEKKINIAESYIQNNETDKAKKYLDSANQTKAKSELEKFISISSGKDPLVAIPDPATESGAIINALAIGDLSFPSSKFPLTKRLIDIRSKNLSPLNTKLEIAKALTEENQQYLALDYLEVIIAENPSLPYLYVLKSENLDSLGKYEDALKAYKLALNLDPSNLGTYKLALEVAKKTSNIDEVNAISTMIAYLEKITK